MATGPKARHFYWSWIKETFTSSAGQFDLWLGGATTVLALVAHYIPAWAKLVNDYEWQIVQLVAALWAATIVVRLLRAPYVMWRDQRQRIEILDAEREPKVEISDPVGMAFPKIHGNNPTLRMFRIEIKNISTASLRNCRVKMARFINRRKEEEGESGYLFRIYRERFSVPGTHDFTQSFDLSGYGDVQSVAIVAMDERVPNSKVSMQYAIASTEKTYADLPRSLFPHWLTVRVTADNLATPSNKSYRIDVTNDGFLRMETVTHVPG